MKLCLEGACSCSRLMVEAFSWVAQTTDARVGRLPLDSAKLMRPQRLSPTARHLGLDRPGRIGRHLRRQRVDFLRLRSQYTELLSPKDRLQLHDVGEVLGAC